MKEHLRDVRDCNKCPGLYTIRMTDRNGASDDPLYDERFPTLTPVNATTGSKPDPDP